MFAALVLFQERTGCIFQVAQISNRKLTPVRIFVAIEYLFVIVSPIMLKLPIISIAQKFAESMRNLLTHFPARPIGRTLARPTYCADRSRLIDLTINQNFLVKLFGIKPAYFLDDVCKSPITTLRFIQNIRNCFELLSPHQLD